MGGQDVTLAMPGGRFNYRIGAIIIHSGNVLMARNSGSPFYYSVGGRAKFGEASRDAVLREAFEETEIEFEIDRLAFIHENFFVLDSTNEPFHEITFFYLMKPDNRAAELKKFGFREDYADVTLHWLPIDGLRNFHVYPEFFKTELSGLSHEVKHFVTKAGLTYRQT